MGGGGTAGIGRPPATPPRMASEEKAVHRELRELHLRPLVE